jgi:hypothetical protein
VLTAFWGSISGKLSDRLAAVSAPALIFWLGGLLAWSYAHGGIHTLARPATWLSRQATITQVLVIAVVLVGVTGSSVLVNRLTPPALRLLEGYWPGWAGPVRRRLVERAVRRGIGEDADWQDLIGQLDDADPAAPADPGAPSALAAPAAPAADPGAPADPDAEAPAAVAAAAADQAERLAKYGRLERARGRRPSRPEFYMPTKVGNILRAAETRPRDKYGLDSVAVWPRLWLTLPDSTRQEITAARAAVDGAVAASIWGILFLVFIPWTVLAVPVGLAVCAVAVLAWLPLRAQAFGELVVAAFDVHRTALYQQLRWPLPASPKDERLQGRLLSTYLQKGSHQPEPVFSPPPGG